MLRPQDPESLGLLDIDPEEDDSEIVDAGAVAGTLDRKSNHVVSEPGFVPEAELGFPLRAIALTNEGEEGDPAERKSQ